MISSARPRPLIINTIPKHASTILDETIIEMPPSLWERKRRQSNVDICHCKFTLLPKSHGLCSSCAKIPASGKRPYINSCACRQNQTQDGHQSARSIRSPSHQNPQTERLLDAPIELSVRGALSVDRQTTRETGALGHLCLAQLGQITRRQYTGGDTHCQ
jgi:hypothetical protein